MQGEHRVLTDYVVYEVNIRVKSEVAEDYVKWLETTHIKDVMKENDFKSSVLFTVLGHEGDTEYRYYTIQSTLDSQEKIENYIVNVAPKMRSLTIEKFGDNFTFERRVLKFRKGFEMV